MIFLNQISVLHFQPVPPKSATRPPETHPSSVKSAAAAATVPKMKYRRLKPASSVYLAGVLDAQKGHAHPERGDPDVHLGSKVPSDPSGQVRELDPPDQVAPGTGLGGLRVPGQHRAQDVVELQPQRGR